MTSHVVRSRPPRGDVVLPPAREITERWLVDAAYFPGGRADACYAPRTEGEVAAVLRKHATVLAIGAQSSLTGGATPAGGALVSMERFDGLAIDARSHRASCGAGVVLSRVRDEARAHRLFCAPAPTYDGATLGGMASTNAAGAATFRYGTMRRSVRGATLVLADGSVLDLRRGECVAHADGWIDVVRRDGATVRVPIPTYRDPAVPKVSAGYFADAAMDVVDLFVGSEGTLGVVTEVVVDLTPLPASQWTCWLPCATEQRALEIVGALRDAAHEARRTSGETGLEVPAIEWIDARSVALLREDGIDVRHGVPLADEVAAALVFSLDVGRDDDAALGRLRAALGDDADRLEVALPDERAKAERFAAMREAVPMCVNHRVRDARLRDAGVTKVAGDFCVPWEVFAESLRRYREAFVRRGLDAAIWGHVSDGNVHPNVIPRSAADVAAGKEALLELAAWVVSVGGSPLAEHGVGRNPAKQEMLRLLRGDRGIDEMRAVKRALDPSGKLAPGVLFGHVGA